MNIDIYKLFKKQLNKTHKLYVHNKKNQQGPFSEYKQKADIFGKAAKLHMAC